MTEQVLTWKGSTFVELHEDPAENKVLKCNVPCNFHLYKNLSGVNYTS